MTNKITNVLFSHVFNDPFMTGTKNLQGTQFENTIGLLDDFIGTLPDNKKSTQLIQLLNAYKFFVEIESKRLSESAPDLACQIVKKIQSLNNDDYCLMPGGYLNKTSGHAMIYKMHYVNQVLTFSIFNSGSGLNYHPKKDTVEKTVYAPVLSYQLTLGQEEGEAESKNLSLKQEKALEKIIIKLILAQDPKHQEIKDADDLYKKVFPQLTLTPLDAKLSTQELPSHYYTAGQISGTCTQRSLHQMLKSTFTDRDEYRQFIYTFKCFVLDTYFHQKQGTDLDESFKPFIIKACQHTLKLLLLPYENNPSVSLFSEEIKERDLTRLLSYLQAARPIKEASCALEITQHVSLPDVEHQLSIRRISEHSDNRQRKKNNQPTPIRPIPLEEKLCIKDIREGINTCEALKKSQKYYDIIELLETFFHTLPLPESQGETPLKSYYSTLDTQKKTKDFLECLIAMQIYYFEAYQQLMPKKITPRMVLSKLSIITLVMHLNNTYSVSLKEGAPSFLSALKKPPLMREKGGAFLSCQHPHLDKRQRHIQNIYNESKSTLPPLTTYYQSLIDEHEEIKTNLETLYLSSYQDNTSEEHKAYQKANLTSLYYFITHYEALESKIEETSIPTLKELKNQFSFQKSLEKSYSIFNQYLNKASITEYSDSSPSIKVEHNEVTAVICIKEDEHEHLRLSNTMLSATKYPRLSTLVKSVFYPDLQQRYTSNEVQLITQKDSNIDILALRELCHLRGDPNTQIVLILEHFTAPSRLKKLSDLSYQAYIEANIFQPGLLEKALRQNDGIAFFKVFNAFIDQGIEQSLRDKQLSIHSIFYLALNMRVLSFAYQSAPKTFQSRWEYAQQALHHHCQKNDEKRIKQALNQSYFNAVMASGFSELTQEKLNLLFQSFCYYQSTHAEPCLEDLADKFELTRNEEAFKKLLVSSPNILTP